MAKLLFFFLSVSFLLLPLSRDNLEYDHSYVNLSLQASSVHLHCHLQPSQRLVGIIILIKSVVQ